MKLSDSFPSASYRMMEENFNEHPDYKSLPESIKAMYSPKEYAWLDDESRNNLLQDITTPEVAED